MCVVLSDIQLSLLIRFGEGHPLGQIVSTGVIAGKLLISKNDPFVLLAYPSYSNYIFLFAEIFFSVLLLFSIVVVSCIVLHRYSCCKSSADEEEHSI